MKWREKIPGGRGSGRAGGRGHTLQLRRSAPPGQATTPAPARGGATLPAASLDVHQLDDAGVADTVQRDHAVASAAVAHVLGVVQRGVQDLLCSCWRRAACWRRFWRCRERAGGPARGSDAAPRRRSAPPPNRKVPLPRRWCRCRSRAPTPLPGWAPGRGWSGTGARGPRWSTATSGCRWSARGRPP